MRLIGAIRKDRKAVPPVIATILMVAIIVVTVVLAYVLFVQVSGVPDGPGRWTGSTPESINVSVSQSPAGRNWVLTFGDDPAAKANSTVFLAIYDPSGVTLLAATSLNALGGLHETYSPITAGTDIAGGDMILLTVSVYPAGSKYQLTNPNGVMAAGTLE